MKHIMQLQKHDIQRLKAGELLTIRCQNGEQFGISFERVYIKKLKDDALEIGEPENPKKSNGRVPCPKCDMGPYKNTNSLKMHMWKKHRR